MGHHKLEQLQIHLNGVCMGQKPVIGPKHGVVLGAVPENIPIHAGVWIYIVLSPRAPGIYTSMILREVLLLVHCNKGLFVLGLLLMTLRRGTSKFC